MSLIFALLVAADPIQIDALNFKIVPLDGWERSETPAGRLHLSKGDAHIWVMVVTQPHRDLDALIEWWRPQMEKLVPKPDARTVKRGKLDGEPCIVVDIAAGKLRVTWVVVKLGTLAYGLYLHRAENSDVEKEIGKIRESFRFLRAAEPKKAAKKPKAKPRAKPQPRMKLSFDHWRFDCVKPAGMRARSAKEFDASEKAAGVVSRFDARATQSILMIRIFAHRKARSHPITMLGEKRIKEFVQRYPKHTEPVVDRKWKMRGARKTLHLRFVGLKGTKVTEDWYFAKCSNGCTYQFQIYRTGAANWKAQIKDFLDSFRPRAKSRIEGP